MGVLGFLYIFFKLNNFWLELEVDKYVYFYNKKKNLEFSI